MEAEEPRVRRRVPGTHELISVDSVQREGDHPVSGEGDVRHDRGGRDRRQRHDPRLRAGIGDPLENQHSLRAPGDGDPSPLGGQAQSGPLDVEGLPLARAPEQESTVQGQRGELTLDRRGEGHPIVQDPRGLAEHPVVPDGRRPEPGFEGRQEQAVAGHLEVAHRQLAHRRRRRDARGMVRIGQVVSVNRAGEGASEERARGLVHRQGGVGPHRLARGQGIVDARELAPRSEPEHDQPETAVIRGVDMVTEDHDLGDVPVGDGDLGHGHQTEVAGGLVGRSPVAGAEGHAEQSEHAQQAGQRHHRGESHPSGVTDRSAPVSPRRA